MSAAVDIVLVNTVNSGNIGSVARAMKNMGFASLTLVSPRCTVDDQSYCMATHGADILQDLQVTDSVRKALSSANYVFGTTARDRRLRKTVTPHDMARTVSGGETSGRYALVFGPEDRGLSNSELEMCDEVVTIPTAEEASSLNISHAVMICCYEINTMLHRKDIIRRPSRTPARAEKTQQMYDHMREVLLDIGFLNPQNPDLVLGHIRRILSRAALSEKEVRIVRGIFRQLRWYIGTLKKNR